MKPVALVERAIRNSSKRRDLVLDPFGGSGSILIACEKARRQARLVELDPKYCDVIVRRWQEFSGGAATLEDDGRTYMRSAPATSTNPPPPRTSPNFVGDRRHHRPAAPTRCRSGPGRGC